MEGIVTVVDEGWPVLALLHEIEPSPPRAYPNVAGAVPVERDHVIAAQAVRFGGIVTETGDLARGRVEPIQPRARQTETARADPQLAVAILDDRRDGVATQTGRVGRVMAIVGKDAGCSVQSFQACAGNPETTGAEPKCAVFVLVNGRDCIAGEAVCVLRVVLITDEGACCAIRACTTHRRWSQSTGCRGCRRGSTRHHVAAKPGRVVRRYW